MTSVNWEDVEVGDHYLLSASGEELAVSGNSEFDDLDPEFHYPDGYIIIEIKEVVKPS